jgi:circadian clock protein KaiC
MTADEPAPSTNSVRDAAAAGDSGGRPAATAPWGAAQRLPSGNPALDEVLGGGLLANSITLLAGLPGTGKTMLAQQYAITNASPERPALYLTTVSEPFDKLIRYAENLTFFDRLSVGRSLLFEDVGAVLREGGLPALLETLDQHLLTSAPGLIVIDSFKALRGFAASEADHRRFLHDAAGRLSALAVSALWLGEYTPEEVRQAPEFAVADAILHLTAAARGERTLRLLEVVKLRGSGFASGQHAYRLSAAGMSVFPRLADPASDSRPAAAAGPRPPRVPSGVAELDGMLDGGYMAGSATLVAGPAGAGKTLLGLHFAATGAQSGEPALVASFQETPEQLRQTAGGLGLRLPAGLHLAHWVPVDLYADEWVHELLAMISSLGLRHVVVDSIGELQQATGDAARFRELLFSLVHRARRQQVTVLLTLEVADLFGALRLSDTAISHLSDNVLMLQYLRGDSQLKRALTVLKTRGSAHDPRIRQFEIGPGGLRLGDPFPLAQPLG